MSCSARAARYFRDVSYAACNKRNPGSGCAALDGFNRTHAVLGVSDQCIATYPGDFAQALIALDASVEIAGRTGTRTIPFAALHRRPGDTPDIETTLQPGEMITAFLIPGGAVDAPFALSQGSRPRILRVRARFGGGRARPRTTASCATHASRSAASRPCPGARRRPKPLLRGQDAQRRDREGGGRGRLRRRAKAASTTHSRSSLASARWSARCCNRRAAHGDLT